MGGWWHYGGMKRKPMSKAAEEAAELRPLQPSPHGEGFLFFERRSPMNTVSTMKTTAEMATLIAESIEYRGGYVYPGTVWEAPGVELSQTRRWAKSPDDPGDVDSNIGALSLLPVGAVVTERTRFSEEERVAWWVKAGADRFERVYEDSVVLALRYSRPDLDEPDRHGGFAYRFVVDAGDLAFHLERCPHDYRHAGAVKGECFDALSVETEADVAEYERLGWLDNWVSA